MGTPRYAELIDLLADYDIDATRVVADSITEDGFEYVAQFRDGRPMYEKVVKLYAGEVVVPEVKVDQRLNNPGPRGKELITDPAAKPTPTPRAKATK